MIRKILFGSAFIAAILITGIYYRSVSRKEPVRVSIDLDEIRKRGRLIAVTDLSSTDYFIFKGEPMGFNYELLKSFSDFVGIDLEIIAENDINLAVDMLRSGKADLLAFGLVPGSGISRDILLSVPVDETRQVLVSRKPRNRSSYTATSDAGSLADGFRDLDGQSVYVQDKSAGAECVSSIAEETGRKIDIIRVPYGSEKLIQHVAGGLIDYTVCNENVAVVNATYYPDIAISSPLKGDEPLSWGVRGMNSEDLLGELNRWIASYRGTVSYSLLHAKYFSNSRSSSIVKSDFYTINTGRISRYDDLIREFSSAIDWDWRLLASLICQESQFRPDVVSGAGAYGLMQIMPVTGRHFGIDISASPENNIKAGILYIKWLYNLFDSKIRDRDERLNFVLAAYNAGPGHVLDAMRLADKNGMDPQKWEGSVAVWMLKKSEPRYYNDSVVKFGYFRGKESVRFVSEVLDRYAHYRNIIPDAAGSPF